MSLNGKTIIITGAARRLGSAMAMACAHNGADIILHYRESSHEVEATSNEIERIGRKSWIIQADLSDSNAVGELMAQAASLSSIFGLINNASIFKSIGFMDTTINDWNDHIQVNLTAPFLLTQAFAHQYSLSAPGRVVNLVDWRALRPGRDHFPYTISKAALVALTKSTALNLAPRINVNAIALGAILPPEDEPENPNLMKNIPQKRWAELDEFTQTVLFLLDGPDYITGEVIHLDGGRHLV